MILPVLLILTWFQVSDSEPSEFPVSATVEEDSSEAPVVQVKASKHAPQEWWAKLSMEEREEMRRRMDQMHTMSPERLAELERRRQIFGEEKDFMLNRMSEAEKQAYEAMTMHEKRRFVMRKVHERLRQRGSDLRARFPGLGHGREGFQKLRREQIRKALDKAVVDGWLGERAGEWLAHAPLHEAMQVMMEVRKWGFLAKAEESDWWGLNSIDEGKRKRITELPAPAFFREIRALDEEVGPENERPSEWHRPGQQGGRRH